jgi:replication initiation protein RepC
LTISHSPTGRRRVTEAQLAATAGLTGRHAPTSPGRVLAAFKKAAPSIGVSRSLVDLIDYLVGRTISADWQGDWAPIVWPSNAEMADRLGRETSRIKELIREAIDAGLILPRDHGTRKRFGKRNLQTGRIIYAYGFDLSPLAERMPEFERAAAEFEARRAEAKELRQEISGLRASILDLAAFATEQSDLSLDWNELASQARSLGASVRASRDPFALAPIAVRMRTMHAQAEAALKPLIPVEKDPAQPENRPHNTTTNQLPIGKPIANDAGGHARGSGGGGGGWDDPSPPRSPEESVRDPFRGFPMTPKIALQISPAFRDLVPTSQPGWAEITEAAFEVRSHLGISQHAYGQACQILGRQGAATAIAAIAAKHQAGLVKSPGGLLRHMVDAHLAGTLRLDRTLFGLIDKAGGIEGGRKQKRSAENAYPAH